MNGIWVRWSLLRRIPRDCCALVAVQVGRCPGAGLITGMVSAVDAAASYVFESVWFGLVRY